MSRPAGSMGWLALGLLLGILVARLTPEVAAQIPFGAVRLMDGAHLQLATVSHVGALRVQCFDTAGVAESCAGAATDAVNVFHQSTIRHISGSVHIAGTISGAQFHIQGLGTPGISHGGVLTVQGIAGMNALAVSQSGQWGVSSAQSGVWTIQAAHQGGEWNVRHVTSATHMIGSMRLMSGTPNNQLAIVTHFGALAVTCYTSAGATETCGGTAGDAVNVFHQSTVAHVSSVTHVSGRVIIQNIAGSAAGVTSNALDVNVTNATLAVTESGTWTVQPGNTVNTSPWLVNVAHISSALHMTNTTVLNALAVRCVNTGATAFEACGGAGAAGDAVNVFHQSTVRHISSVTHVAGTVRLSDTAGNVVGVTSNALNVAQAGTWTVQPGNTPNTTAWLTNIGHISSVLHIQVAGAGIPGASLSVRCVNTGGTAFADCGGAGGSGDAVNVFHQSTVRHISSVTHVSGTTSLVARDGTYAAFAGTSLLVASSSAQSGPWTVQAAHQGGEWNLRHVSSVLHVVVISQATGIGRTITYVSVNQGAAGTTTLAAAVAGLNHKILGGVLTMSVLGTLKFTDGVADLTGPMDVAATGGFVLPTSPIPYQQTGATNRALNLVTTLGAARGVVIIVTEP